MTTGSRIPCCKSLCWASPPRCVKGEGSDGLSWKLVCLTVRTFVWRTPVGTGLCFNQREVLSVEVVMHHISDCPHKDRSVWEASLHPRLTSGSSHTHTHCAMTSSSPLYVCQLQLMMSSGGLLLSETEFSLSFYVYIYSSVMMKCDKVHLLKYSSIFMSSSTPQRQIFNPPQISFLPFLSNEKHVSPVDECLWETEAWWENSPLSEVN